MTVLGVSRYEIEVLNTSHENFAPSRAWPEVCAHRNPALDVTRYQVNGSAIRVRATP